MTTGVAVSTISTELRTISATSLTFTCVRQRSHLDVRATHFADIGHPSPKGNPNPSPATRFSADNPGRAKQKGARDRLSAAFLNDFADDYEAHGKAVIETVRGQDPVAYMRLAA